MGSKLRFFLLCSHPSLLKYHLVLSISLPQVPEEKLLPILERALINVVNVMGVDINEAIESPYIAHTLQYVSGLGPRKAQSIMKRIEATVGLKVFFRKLHVSVCRFQYCLWIQG